MGLKTRINDTKLENELLMKVTTTPISDILILEPQIYKDNRGFFFESFNQNRFNKAVGKQVVFVQDNHSCSTKGVLRGLHYQIQPYAQSKLIWVVEGKIFDVVVDIRRSSATFKKWIGINLSAENKKQLWIPEGFAHGFLVLSDKATVLYKTTAYWNRESERNICWNDVDLNIRWPSVIKKKIVSPKDRLCTPFSSALWLFD